MPEESDQHDGPRDTFSSRLSEQPARAQIAYHRVPNFRARLPYVWEPLLDLNHAQAIALQEAGILEPAEAAAIQESLVGLERSVDIAEFDAFEEFEGPYFYIEDHLLREVGEAVGGKLHTGRSRNDLYAAAFRVAVRNELVGVLKAVVDLREAVLDRAAETEEVVFPAFTHSQPAQPITFAHYLASVAGVLRRDFARIRGAFETTNQSPLGAAAIGGTGFALDRDRLADLMGFSGVVACTYDGIASVDYAPEAAGAMALAVTTQSRVAQDILVWSMFEVGFVDLGEGLSSVSSIMPQKKNPGVVETVRAAACGPIAGANETLTMLRGVPYGDIGEGVYVVMPVLSAAAEVVRSLRLMAAIVRDLRVNQDRMYEDAVESYCTMTELADTLVRDAGLSFRQAHEVVGRLTSRVVADGRRADEITMDDLDAAAAEMIGVSGLLPEEALAAALDPWENVARRDIAGGTAPSQTAAVLAGERDRVAEDRAWLAETTEGLAVARDARRPASE